MMDWHPSLDAIRAGVYGWADAPDAPDATHHAENCPRCRPALDAERVLRHLLRQLPAYEPRAGEDPATEVLASLHPAPPNARPKRVRSRLAAVAALVLVLLTGTALGVPAALDAAAEWLHSIVVRQVAPAGQPDAPEAKSMPPGGPALRVTSLEEARRAVTFPVEPPRSVAAGFTLDGVSLFQPPTSTTPTQVILTYRRPGAHQPLAIAYQSRPEQGVVSVLPGSTRELVVNGQRALYIDQAGEDLRGADGTVLETGRLILERTDVVLSISGDRRDGLDADHLAAIVASVP